MNCRQPTAMDWRIKWEAALSNIECSRGPFTCIRHFSSNELIKKRGKHVLKPMAVPTIFETYNKSSDDAMPQANDAVSIQNLMPGAIDVFVVDDPNDKTPDDTISQGNDAELIPNSVIVCNCTSMEQTIQTQLNEITSQQKIIKRKSNEILSLKTTIQTQSDEMKRKIQIQSKEILTTKEIIKQQSNEILSLTTTIRIQSDEISDLKAQLSTLTSKHQCPLIKFAIEAKDTKVLE